MAPTQKEMRKYIQALAHHKHKDTLGDYCKSLAPTPKGKVEYKY